MSLTLFTTGLDLVTDQLGGGRMGGGALEHDQKNVSAQGFMVDYCRQC